MILTNPIAKKILIALTIFFVLFSLYDLTQSKAEYFDSIPTAVECIILMGCAVYYFYEQMKQPNSLFLYNTPIFWIVVGIMLFFAGSFFIFIYAQSNSNSPEFKLTFKLISAILTFIENILFLIAFLIARNQSKAIKPNIIAKN
jgi:hypothetical protein